MQPSGRPEAEAEAEAHCMRAHPRPPQAIHHPLAASALISDGYRGPGRPGQVCRVSVRLDPSRARSDPMKGA